MGTEAVGVLSLGLLVGFLLGFGLLNSGPTLKAVLTVLGAALGGGPVLFMAGTSQKWMYPIGLLLGLLWLRVPPARMAIAVKIAHPGKGKKVHGYFAWIDLVVIAAVTLAAAVYAILTAEKPPPQALQQTGRAVLVSGTSQLPGGPPRC